MNGMTLNLYAAWVGFLLGGVAGATTGLFFRGEDWLGGYGAWRRRMVRLGHVAFFGIGFLNLALALTADVLGIAADARLSGWLLIIGALTMPLVCYLSAYREGFRHLFFVPAGAVIVGIASFLWRMAAQ